MIGSIKEKLRQLDLFFRSRATQTLEWEAAELENIFTLLTVGQWVGLPAPPPGISLQLLPDMEDLLIHMILRDDLARSPLSQLFSVLEVS